MNSRVPLDPRSLEALSASLDGQLAGAEKAALEERLSQEEDLRLHLAELRAVRDSLRALPPIKPPRRLTLTPAQAGEPVRRFEWFSSGRLALGSALAAMAFAVVFSANLFSRGLTLGAAAPVAENFAAPAMLQSADQSAPAGGGANAPTTAPQPTLGLPAPTAAAPREKFGGGESPTSTGMPASDDCGEPSVANQAAERCGLDTAFSEEQAIRLPDFPTLAPYLEVFLGLAAIILAVLAVISRRRSQK